MLAICTYSLDRCGASEAVDVVSNHQFALIRRGGECVRIESSVRKRVEEQAKQLKEYLELQIDRMPIGLVVWDTEFRAQSWNPAAEKIFGFTMEEALGKHPYDLIVPKEAQPHVDNIWHRLLEGDTAAHSINENMTKDGRTIICEWTNTPLKKADGTVVGVLSMVQDITERKRAEEALEENERRYRLLAENAKDVIWTVDMNMRPTYMSPSITHLLGYTVEEAMALPMEAVFTPASLDIAMKVLAEELAVENMEQKDLSRSRTLELELNRKDGSIVPVECKFTFIRGPDGQPVAQMLLTYAVTLAEVYVNIKTGEVKVPRVFNVMNPGKVINQLAFEQQGEGSVLCGLGFALKEDFIPGKSRSFKDYRIPTVADAPEVVSIVVEIPVPSGPFGAKGIAETAAVGTPPAVINAITDATGARIYELPATPERVLATLSSNQKGEGSVV